MTDQVNDLGLSKGQLIYLKDHCHQGHHKIQDVWSPVLYQVVNVPNKPGAPYIFTPDDGTGNVHWVHRTEMWAALLDNHPCEPVKPQPCLQSGVPEGKLVSEEEDCLAWPVKVYSVFGLFHRGGILCANTW